MQRQLRACSTLKLCVVPMKSSVDHPSRTCLVVLSDQIPGLVIYQQTAKIMGLERFLLVFSRIPSLLLMLFNADCGAGVGRVAKELLLHVFQEVDLLEPSQHLLEAASECSSLDQTTDTTVH